MIVTVRLILHFVLWLGVMLVAYRWRSCFVCRCRTKIISLLWYSRTNALVQKFHCAGIDVPAQWYSCGFIDSSFLRQKRERGCLIVGDVQTVGVPGEGFALAVGTDEVGL